MINKRIVKNNFSKYAKFYDSYANIQNLCASDLIDLIEKKNFKKILDIGCGTANFTKLLSAKFSLANIKAIDISDEMIQIAKKKIPQDRVDFYVQDAEQLNLKDNFDLISSNATFQWFDDLGSSLKNYKKMLTKGGVIAFSIFGPLTFYELAESSKQFLQKSKSISASSFIGEEKIRSALKSNFSKVKVEQKVYKEKSGSLKELLKKIKYTGTRGKAVHKGFWTKKTISKIENIYKKKFKDIVATYQVFFCKGIV